MFRSEPHPACGCLWPVPSGDHLAALSRCPAQPDPVWPCVPRRGPRALSPVHCTENDPLQRSTPSFACCRPGGGLAWHGIARRTGCPQGWGGGHHRGHGTRLLLGVVSGQWCCSQAVAPRGRGAKIVGDVGGGAPGPGEGLARAQPGVRTRPPARRSQGQPVQPNVAWGRRRPPPNKTSATRGARMPSSFIKADSEDGVEGESPLALDVKEKTRPGPRAAGWLGSRHCVPCRARPGRRGRGVFGTTTLSVFCPGDAGTPGRPGHYGSALRPALRPGRDAACRMRPKATPRHALDRIEPGRAVSTLLSYNRLSPMV